MSTSPLFKRAFVRGLNSELIRQGAVVYPSKQAADATADYVADNSGMPDPYLASKDLNIKIAEELAQYLVQGAEYQCKNAGGRYNPDVTKTAQEETPVSIANSEAWALLEKAAAETGSLVEGGDNPNDQSAAAKDNAEAALENKNRPENYANLGEKGVGNYERKGEGSVGSEEKHPDAPGASDSGSNSVTENSSKSASLADIIRRVGKTADTGSLITGGTQANDLPAAASSNAEAALEASNRPEGYANLGERGVGQTDLDIPSGAVVGNEQPHPLEPMATDAGSNSIVDQSKNAFDMLFTQTAQQVVPYLPVAMHDEQKVAHVRAVMGFDTAERATYLQNLYTDLGMQKEAAATVRAHFMKSAACSTSAKAAPAMPPAMKAPKPNGKPKTAAAAAPSLGALRERLRTINA